MSYAVQKWIHKIDLQPEDGKSPNYVAVDEILIQLNRDRYWPLATADAETNEFPHMRLRPACSTTLTERFFRELREKHDIANAPFLVDGTLWL